LSVVKDAVVMRRIDGGGDGLGRCAGPGSSCVEGRVAIHIDTDMDMDIASLRDDSINYSSGILLS
jgi:hypothetical protein